MNETGYREPEWLGWPAAAGSRSEMSLPRPGTSGDTVVRVWSPSIATDRVLLAHDGPDYERHGDLVRYTEAMIGAGRLPPYHLVLLGAEDRDDRYSANPDHARWLIADALPALRAALGVAAPPVAVGASLGALAVLHAQWRYPGAFAGMLLQSGSFFQPRFDAQESGFRYYPRIVRFVAEVLGETPGPRVVVPTVLTCGVAEENLANNRDMALALRRRGYPCRLVEVAGAHTWFGWRNAWDASLTGLVRSVWTQ